MFPFHRLLNLVPSYELELSEMIMSVMLESHAWSSARSKHEDTRNSQKFEEKILSVMDEEKEQGMSTSILRSSFQPASSFLFVAVGRPNFAIFR